MNLLKWVLNSIGYAHRPDIAKGQRQIQALKAQIDALSKRLRSIEKMTAAAEIELSGPGPFRLPMPTQFKSLVTDMEDRFVAEFESQDGTQIFAILPHLVAAQILNADLSLPLQDATSFSSTSIDLPNSADAFCLPTLWHLEGYFYHGSNLRVLVFSSHEGRKVFLPVLVESYDNLIRHFEAALVPTSIETPLGSSLSNLARYPVRSRQ
jgi:hypothetical protein